MNALLKEGEVASWLRVSLAALQRWRFEGRPTVCENWSCRSVRPSKG
jgi:hypothetical protein